MAITASVALSSSTAKSEQKVTATLTVSNSGGAAVNVTAIVPTMPLSGGTKGSTSVALGVPPLLPGQTTSVGAGGNTAFAWDVMAHAPVTSYNVGAEPSSFAYDVGAIVYTSDGSVTVATTATLTVSNPAS